MQVAPGLDQLLCKFLELDLLWESIKGIKLVNQLECYLPLS